MTRHEAVNFLLNNPVKFAHMLGFNKLVEPLHDTWIKDMMLGKDDATLQGHRGSYKTTCLSVALSLIIILLPNAHTLFMRKTDTDVKEVIKQVGNILKDPHTLYFVRCIYNADLKLTVDSATEISTNLCRDIKGTSQLVGVGIGSSLTGKHYDRIFTDDIVNLSDRISRAERERTKIVYQELQNVKNRGGRIYNTGTPWHKDDCFSLMPKARKYDCYSTGLITADELASIKENMVASLFAANYELRHIASDDVIFTNPQTHADPSLVDNGFAHVDAAYTGEDYTAFTIMQIHNDTIYVLGKCWRKHVDDCEADIINIRKSNNAGKIMCETNADKGYLAKDLKNKGERVYTYHESMNKHVKITTYLKGIWSHVVFVEGTDEDYINQICDYNEHAEHDDCPDSLASLIRSRWEKIKLLQKVSSDDAANMAAAYKPLWN